MLDREALRKRKFFINKISLINRYKGFFDIEYSIYIICSTKVHSHSYSLNSFMSKEREIEYI
ncbi:hypothetical protein C1646_690494 [Rhizophagus diaphanus]|nr:hypothetical protein C1646_690494 [Rhizophagus diaphanus] [Rhizophagus sp. MUCL 43196]